MTKPACQEPFGFKTTSVELRSKTKEAPVPPKPLPDRDAQRRLIDAAIERLLVLLSRRASHDVLVQKVEALYGHTVRLPGSALKLEVRGEGSAGTQLTFNLRADPNRHGPATPQFFSGRRRAVPRGPDRATCPATFGGTVPTGALSPGARGTDVSGGDKQCR